MVRREKRPKRKLDPNAEITNIIDEALDVPEEHGGLIENGKLNFLLNRNTMEFISEITDALMLSRGIPPNPGSISVADDVVVHILIKEPELEELDALEKAQNWYRQQQVRANSDAMIIAITDNNEFNMSAKPYADGEVAFDNKSTREGGTTPKWRAEAAEIQIPPPYRDLNNIYERRLKTVYDFLNICGTRFTGTFWGIFNRAMGETIRLLNEQDSDGFHKKPTRKSVSVVARAADKATGDTAQE